jgi:DNA-binding CsgD family transcriptional regulator
MELISVHQVQALIRSVERIHSAENLQHFPATVLGALRDLINESILSLNIVNLKTGEVGGVSSENRHAATDFQKIVKLAPIKAAMPVVRSGDRGAITIPDCVAQRELEKTGLYVDLFSPLGIRHNKEVTLAIPGHVVSLTASRNTDLTDEEMLLLRLIAPQIALAHRNLQRLESLKNSSAEVVPSPTDLERLGLTPREAEVLHWVIKGKQDAVIASILNISVRTVHHHIARILRKLQSESRGSAGYEAMVKLKELESHPAFG